MTGSHAAEMEAKEAIDAWGWEVEYYFECVHGDGHDSGWQKSRVYMDTGLSKRPGVRLSRQGPRRYWAMRRSGPTIRFAGVVDTTPPTPSPFIQTIAADSLDADHDDGPDRLRRPSGVQYFFDTNTPGAHDSGWIDTPSIPT